MKNNEIKITRFGFTFNKSGIHTRRTMMLDELLLLLDYVQDPSATKDDYITAICKDNCLRKRSGENRNYSAKYLTELYALEPALPIFRVLRYFWDRDEKARPLLALLCAYARDSFLRMSMSHIFKYREGDTVNKLELEEHINDLFPERFSKNTLGSITRNLNATWTKTGHLTGLTNKTRSKAHATPGATAYALLLGYLSGGRGKSLFHIDYARLLDCSIDNLIELAEEASRRGWIVFKRVGDVIEVQFNGLLTKEEMEWVYEQNR